MSAAGEVIQPTEPVRFWLNEIEQSRKWHNDWHEKGAEVNKRYLDERDLNNSATGMSMNTLWSNVETTSPALYAKTPNPRVQRRFRDKDPVGRWAAIVMERCEAYELDAYDDDYHYRAAIKDYLLPGRGQVWVNYEPKFASTPEGQKKLVWECTRIRHINWKDFRTNRARTWDEVWWVGKCEYLSEDEAKAQGLDTKNLVFQDDKDVNDKSKEGLPKKAPVWEIWNKVDGKIYFVSKSSPEMLRKPAPPPFNLEGFFPCPRPITATTNTDSIIPTPDYCLYQDQAKEIDQLTRRINLLTKALRVAGVYDASQEALGRLLDDQNDNVMIPCETYAVLAAQGGVEGSVSFFPIKDLILALKQCYESRDQAMAIMFQVTGISDIVRGASDPNETATAQSIKSQWGGLRIRDRQKEVQRFVRDTIRIKSEIRAEVFSPETLRAMSNVPLLASQKEKQALQARQQQAQMLQQAAQQNPQMAQMVAQQRPDLAAMAKPLTPDELQKLKEPTFEEVYHLLKNERLRGYRIDIETDSTIQADEMEEKTARTEYIAAMTSFLQGVGPLVVQEPRLAPVVGEMMLFGSRAFKTADTLETAIQEFVDSLQQQPPAQPPPEQAGPTEDPRVEGARLQIENKKVDNQFAIDNRALDLEERAQTIDTQLAVADLNLHAGEMQQNAAMNQQQMEQAERQDIRGGLIQREANKSRFQQRSRPNG